MNRKTRSGAWIDISTTIREDLVVWPGDPQPKITALSTLSQGDECNLSGISISLHTGTHLDAPRHYLDHGKTIDNLDPNDLTGPVKILEVTKGLAIGKKELEPFDIYPGDKLFLKTANSELDWQRRAFLTEYAHLTPQAAAYLVSRQVSLIGIDYLSIGDNQSGPEVHRTLLGSNILILEGLLLKDIEPGEYDMVCLPLKVAGADGSPARTIIRKMG